VVVGSLIREVSVSYTLSGLANVVEDVDPVEVGVVAVFEDATMIKIELTKNQE